MLRTLAAVLVSFALYVPSASARDVEHSACVGYGWEFLSDSSVPLYGVEPEFQTLTQAIRETLAHDAQPPAAEIRVIDCPVYDNDPYVQALSAEQNIIGAHWPASYGVYASVGYLRGRDSSDLMREGRKLACLMREHSFDAAYFNVYVLVPKSARRCMLSEARAANDVDYARWLARTLPPELLPTWMSRQ